MEQTDFISRDIINLKEEDAQKIALLFLKKDRKLGRSNEMLIDDVQTIFDSLSCPLMYAVNFSNDNGYVLVSATKKHYPVLSYSEEGRFNATQPGMDIWLETEKKIIKDLLNIPMKSFNPYWMQYEEDESISNNIVSRAESSTPQDIEWWWTEHIHDIKYTNKYDAYEGETPSGYTLDGDYYCKVGAAMNYCPNLDDFFNTMAERCKIYGYSPQDVIYHIRTYSRIIKKDKLLTTKWHQGYPYNDATGGKSLGCATIAVGQIMNYHKYPDIFNWNKINIYDSQEQKDFLKRIGENLHIDYDGDNSGAKIEYAIMALEAYGYKVSHKNNYDFHRIKQEIDRKQPIYMRGRTHQVLGFDAGDGHAWVCDGYESSGSYNVITVYAPFAFENPGGLISTDPYVAQEDMKSSEGMGEYNYCHMNWGWKDSQNKTMSESWVRSGEYNAPNGEVYKRNTEFLYISK